MFNLCLVQRPGRYRQTKSPAERFYAPALIDFLLLLVLPGALAALKVPITAESKAGLAASAAVRPGFHMTRIEGAARIQLQVRNIPTSPWVTPTRQA